MTVLERKIYFPFRRRQTHGHDGFDNLLALEKTLSNLSLSSANTIGNEEESNDSLRTGPFGLTQLNAPAEPLVELVFVHGLGGGSRKSWSQSESSDHFWPQSWLPRDPDFHNVRIYSFGYRSTKSEVVTTIFGIPDIAQSLLSALRDNGAIRQSQNAIILVGHSMGGLVVKKGFILAHNTEIYRDLAARFQSLYFLGTPHQGSGFPKIFYHLVRRLPIISTTENVSDLDPASRLIESLNQEFPRVAQKIELRSFWETQPSLILGRHQFVVPKNSACLNYTNEVTDGLDADHRGMCKYDRPTNSNYQKVRNALAASVATLVQDHAERNQESDLQTLEILRRFFNIHEPPEDDLADRLDSCLSSETCSWFITRGDYQRWRDNDTEESIGNSDFRDVILIEAEPGAGKSVLAAQVINNLRALNCDCSFFFFDAHDRVKSTLNHLLRSLAFQMALLNPNIRNELIQLQQQGVQVRDHDDKYIWRKIFSNCILKLPQQRRQFWVIDGLDECQQTIPLLQMFLRTVSISPPKIFATVRPNVGIHYEMSLHQNRISKLYISPGDTLGSIQAYIEIRTSHLRLRTRDERAKLVETILHTADGSFLWVKLVLDNINKATGPKQIMDAIDQIPKGMDQLYAGLLEALEVSTSTLEKPTIRAVLEWTMCANPPLRTEELEAAVLLDTGSAIFIDKMRESLQGLLVVDHGGRVRPIHQTARTYLMNSKTESSFAICPTKTHSKIAVLLVNYLRQRLRNLRNGSQLIIWDAEKKGMDTYAISYFSDHIRRADAHDHDLFGDVERFFAQCGNSWVACTALSGSLSNVIKTSQNLRTWMQARLKQTPPIGELARKTLYVQQWATDLERIVAKFGRHLLQCPGAMYTLLPAFVPKESVLYSSRPRPRDFQVSGLEFEKWDDRLCSKFYEGSICTAVASGKHNFAVALRNGLVHVYDNNTMQPITILNHGALVKVLKYNIAGSMLLSAGFRKMKMWTFPGAQLLWEFEFGVGERRLAVEFLPDNQTLISISSQHKIVKHDLCTGMVVQTNERRPSTVNDDCSQIFRRELQYAEFSVETEMLATMERERPIQLTDIEDRYDVGVVELESSDHEDNQDSMQPVTAMAFCANIDIALLAAVYRDGVLAIFDRDLRLIEKRADSKGATLLAGSPSGLHLAAASVEGVIMLYEFEQLTLLHTLYTYSFENIRALAFSGDGHRIIDIRDKQANVWVPATLFSRPREDTDSISESTLAPTVITSPFTGLQDNASDVLSLVTCPTSEYFICGREDGSVAVHSTKVAQWCKPIFQDVRKQWISKLVWKPESRMLISLSGTSTVSVYIVSSQWTILQLLLRHDFSNPVKEMFANARNKNLFVVTTATIHLWTLSDSSDVQTGYRVLTETKLHDFVTTGIWTEDASGFLIHAEPQDFSKFTWTMDKVDSTGISYENSDGVEVFTDGQKDLRTFDRGAAFSQGSKPMLFLRSTSASNTSTLSSSSSAPPASSGRPRWIVDLSHQGTSSAAPHLDRLTPTTVALHASLLPVSHLIEHVIGIVQDGRSLLFLNKELWVCSYDLAPPTARNTSRRPSLAIVKPHNDGPPSYLPRTYTRHFFVPDEWISSTYSNANGQLLFTHGGVKDECLIFVKKHEVAVIKNPFAYAETVAI